MASSQNLKPISILLLVLALLGVWRWWVGVGLPLSVDEAYYFAWSRTIDWGYWTKPPLIAWTIGAADAVCGATVGCVRSVSVLAFALTPLLIYALARQMAFDTGTSLTMAVGFASLPLASFYGLAASTDALLLLCWACGMLSFWIALQGQRWAWVALGFSVGLGLLAKYSMAVFGLSAIWVLLWPQWRGQWRQLGPYLAAAIALALFMPNLWWNLNHGNPTLQHTAQISRGAAYAPEFGRLLVFWGEQWLVGNVVLVGAFLCWLWRGKWRHSSRDGYLLAFSLPMLLVISLQALLSRAHANWAAPAHIALVMAATLALLEFKHRFWWFLALVFNLLFAILLYHGQTLVREPLGLVPSSRNDPYWGLRNWPLIHQQTRELLETTAERADWRIASDDRGVLAQLQWGLQLPVGSVLGWQKTGAAKNHFDQRFPLQPGIGRVLLLTRSSNAEVLQHFPQATPAGHLFSGEIADRPIALAAWWLN